MRRPKGTAACSVCRGEARATAKTNPDHGHKLIESDPDDSEFDELIRELVPELDSQPEPPAEPEAQE